jgi:hypothetical protein
MSHFTRIKTQMVEAEYLTQTLADLGYPYEEGDAEIRGYGGKRTHVEIKVPTQGRGYDIGFRKSGESYEIVADWWGIRDVNQKDFQRQVTQRYAYNVARAKLERQGFNLVSEEVEQNGQIHLVLRRMV